MRQLQYSNLAKNLWLKNYGLLHRGLLRLTHVAKKYLLNIIPFIIKQPRPFTLRLVLVAAVLGFGLHFGLGLTTFKAVFITGIILSSFFFAAMRKDFKLKGVFEKLREMVVGTGYDENDYVSYSDWLS